MSEPIVILHGWSDSAKSFRAMGKYLQQKFGGSVTEIDLADWLSLNDEITFNDLRNAMDLAWSRHPVLASAARVNLVTHSTGALVVRDWMTWKYKSADECPILRHVMLAPANFGSPLAHKGRSFLGRVFKGGFSTGFQTGTHLLHGLELASDYTWNLAEKDVFSTKWYGSGKIMASVVVGSSGYGGIKQVANEYGSDGTVRVSTANLNAAKLTLEFQEDGTVTNYQYTEVPSSRQAAYLVLEHIHHGTITHPETPFKNAVPDDSFFASIETIGEWVYKALQVMPDQWEPWKQACSDDVRRLYGLAEFDDSVHPYYHAYQNTVVRAQDQYGNDVEEYLVEFCSDTRTRFSSKDIGFLFHQNIIQDVHCYKKNTAYRAFHLDITEIEQAIDLEKKRLLLEVDPEPHLSHRQPVGYAKVGSIEITPNFYQDLFQRNRTLLIDVRFNRQMDLPKVFTIKQWKKY